MFNVVIILQYHDFFWSKTPNFDQESPNFCFFLKLAPEPRCSHENLYFLLWIIKINPGSCRLSYVLTNKDLLKQFIGNKTKGLISKTEVTRKQSTPDFPKNEHFSPYDTHMYEQLLFLKSLVSHNFWQIQKIKDLLFFGVQHLPVDQILSLSILNKSNYLTFDKIG